MLITSAAARAGGALSWLLTGLCAWPRWCCCCFSVLALAELLVLRRDWRRCGLLLIAPRSVVCSCRVRGALCELDLGVVVPVLLLLFTSAAARAGGALSRLFTWALCVWPRWCGLLVLAVAVVICRLVHFRRCSHRSHWLPSPGRSLLDLGRRGARVVVERRRVQPPKEERINCCAGVDTTGCYPVELTRVT